jgi:glycosyltransferase involved in cell wall biosynthesis
LKVVFATREYDDLSGGQNTWLADFLPELAKRGIDVSVLYFTSEKLHATAFSLHRRRIALRTCFNDQAVSTEKKVRWILAQLAADPPDVFVVNMVIPAALYAARWLGLAGIPTVAICHVGPAHQLYRGLLGSFVLGDPDYRVSRLVCVSEHLTETVSKLAPAWCIPCGIKIPEQTAGPPRDKLRLAYVGRLAEEAKRIVEVTEALCRVVREVPGTEAVIIGDGEERERVAAIVGENSRYPIKMAGKVKHEEINGYLLRCHAIALLSDWEGFGRSLLEGMACGLVPIGLRAAHPWAEELIAHGVNGLLVRDREDDFVDAVRQLHGPAWQTLSRSARRVAQARYSMAACVDQWSHLLEELASHRACGPPIDVARRIKLPPVNPDLAWLDRREPSLYRRLYDIGLWGWERWRGGSP